MTEKRKRPAQYRSRQWKLREAAPALGVTVESAGRTLLQFEHRMAAMLADLTARTPGGRACDAKSVLAAVLDVYGRLYAADADKARLYLADELDRAAPPADRSPKPARRPGWPGGSKRKDPLPPGPADAQAGGLMLTRFVETV